MGINAVAVLAYSSTQDLSSPTGLLEMIQMSVRCSVPFLYLAFVTSALKHLWPTSFSHWLLKNRRYIGLAFASAMGWQLLFILLLWEGHWEYYVEEAYFLLAILFEVPGYLFIFAMTISSFMPIRQKMNGIAWRILHWVGIYLLWFTITITYYLELHYGEDIQVIDYIYFVGGVVVYLMRVGAWLSQRTIQSVAP